MAGPLAHTWTKGVKDEFNSSLLAESVTIAATAQQNFYESVPAAGFIEIDLDITVANIKSFFVTTDQPVQFETNARGTGHAQTFDLAVKPALAWNLNEQTANPLTTNITKLFFTNAGATAAIVRGSFLLNQ